MKFRIHQNNEAKLWFKSAPSAMEGVMLVKDNDGEPGPEPKISRVKMSLAINWEDDGTVEFIADGKVQMSFHPRMFRAHSQEITLVIERAAIEAAEKEAEKNE